MLMVVIWYVDNALLDTRAEADSEFTNHRYPMDSDIIKLVFNNTVYLNVQPLVQLIKYLGIFHSTDVNYRHC